jgi:hypothetical protein
VAPPPPLGRPGAGQGSRSQKEAIKKKDFLFLMVKKKPSKIRNFLFFTVFLTLKIIHTCFSHLGKTVKNKGWWGTTEGAIEGAMAERQLGGWISFMNENGGAATGSLETSIVLKSITLTIPYEWIRFIWLPGFHYINQRTYENQS